MAAKFEFVQELESILGQRCVGLRRCLNRCNLDQIDAAMLRRFVLGDVTKNHMQNSIDLFVKHMRMSKLDAALKLEELGYATLPRLVTYMDKASQQKVCDKAIREVLIQRVWPKLL